MIRKLLILLAILCIFSPPAGAAIWLFGGKKQESKNAGTPEGQNTPLFVPQEKVDPRIFSGVPQVQQNQTLPAGLDSPEFKNLKPEMLEIGYTPKTAEEILMISHAKNTWQDDAMAKMERAAQTRMAAAQRKSDEALRKLEMKGQMSTPKTAGGASAQTPQGKPSKVILYNNTTPDSPTKVFKNYR